MKTVALALATLFTLSGCAAVKGADKPVTMRLSPAFAAGKPTASPTFSVAPVQARGVTGGLRYAYVDAAAPREIRQAATLFWEEPPPTVIARAIVAGLRTRYAQVAGPELALSADRRVVAVIDRFEEEVSGVDTRATVAFDVTQVSGGKAIWAGRYCVTRPIGAAAGSIRAEAFEAAIEAAVAALVQDIATGSVTAADC
ncbi:MAG: ABC-type transport auxiliary lipoprotein family protein [Sphingobium sp.]